MDNAVSDGTGGEEKEDEEGVKEGEDEDFNGEEGRLLLLLLRKLRWFSRVGVEDLGKS